MKIAGPNVPGSGAQAAPKPVQTKVAPSRPQRGAAGISMPTIRVKAQQPKGPGLGDGIFGALGRLSKNLNREAQHVSSLPAQRVANASLFGLPPMESVGPGGPSGPGGPTAAQTAKQNRNVVGMDVVRQIQAEIQKALAVRDKSNAASVDDYLQKLRHALVQQKAFVGQVEESNASADPMSDAVQHFYDTAPTALYQGLDLQTLVHALEHPIGYGQGTQFDTDQTNANSSARSVLEAVTGYQQIEHIGSDPLGGGLALAAGIPILKPFRLAGALEEGTRAALTADEARIASGVDAAKSAFDANRGIVRPIFRAGNNLRPSVRALNASPARRDLFALIDERLPARDAKAVKAVWDRAVRTMVKNGEASSYAEALNHLHGVSGDGPLGEFLAQIGHESGGERIVGANDGKAHDGGFDIQREHVRAGEQAGLGGKERPWLRVRRNGRPGVSQFTRVRTEEEHRKFLAALTRNSRPENLSAHSLEEVANAAHVFLSEDGHAGAMVTREGDLQNVFRNPEGVPGAGRDVVDLGLAHGAKTLDNYDGFLTDRYRSHGFGVTGRMKFKDEFAPEGWDYAKKGRPDIVFMSHGAKDLGEDAPFYDDWGKAKADSVAAAKQHPFAPGSANVDPGLAQTGEDGIKGYFHLVEHKNGDVQDGLAASIGLTKSADATTVIHELGHFLGHFGLGPAAAKTIEGWVGKPFYLWDVAEHEQFAQGLEAFVHSGDAPNTLKAEFEKLSPVFHDAYPSTGDLPALPKDVAAVYKKLLGHRDGLPSAVYFAVRNKAVAGVLARAHGAVRSDEEARQHLADVAEQLRAKGIGIKASEIPIVKPGEKPEEFAGELGHRIRAHIAGRPDTEGMGTYEAVGAKLDTPAQRVVREKQLEGYSVERGRRAARGSDAFQSAGGGLAGHFAAKGKLAGELAKESTAALDLSSEEADHLANWIESHAKLDGKFYSRRRAVDAILKLTRGELLQENEERLLGSIFGKMDNPRSFRAEWKSASWKQRALDMLNVPRSLQATLDQSAAFRHGLVAGVSNPRAWARQWGPMYKAMWKESNFAEQQAAIHEMDTFPLMDAGAFNDRISFTAPGENLSRREEQFQSNIAEHIPYGVGAVVRAGDRGYTGFLNGLRAAEADALYMKAAKAGWDLADEDVRGSINRFVNSATGRGSLGMAQKHAVTLNTLLFSPRLLWSRLNFLNPLWYASLHPFARREAWIAMSRLLGLTVGVLGTAALSGATVVMDPTNADFGKMKFGNTRIDFLGGFQQPIRLAAQMIEGKVTSSETGKVESLSGQAFGLSRADILWRFFQNKLAPVPAGSVEALQGQDPASHQPLDWTGFGAYKTVILNHMIPLILQDLWGLPNDKLYLAPLPTVGIGTQDYGASKSAAAKSQDAWTQTAEKALGEKLPPEIIKIRATKTEYENLESNLGGGKHTDAQRAELLLQVFLEQNPSSSSDKSAFEEWIKADPSGAMSKFEGWLGWSQLDQIDSLVNKIVKAQAHGG